MWSVVNFKSDNSVETVPSFWFKKDKCAWPKKKTLQCLLNVGYYLTNLILNIWMPGK